MNILIVDDDRFVIAFLVQKIDWTSLGLEHVYTANNVTQAKKIILEESIHILISDIDMPQESGLDLLSWVRSENKKIQVIFLTNYADFNYAKKALELQTLDYYLKPIETDKLIPIIQKAINKVNELQSITQANSIVNLWENNKVKLYEHFWHSYLKKEIDLSPNNLESYIEANHLPYKNSDVFIMLLFDFYPYSLSIHNEIVYFFEDPKDQIEHLNSAFYANFTDVISPLDIIIESPITTNQNIAIINCNNMTIANNLLPNLVSNSENLISTIQNQFNCSLSCYIGIASTVSCLHNVLDDLKKMSMDIVDCRNQVFTLTDYMPISITYEFTKLNFLDIQLESGNRSEFINTCHEYMVAASKESMLNYDILNSFQIDITQLIYSFLKEKGILAHKLLQGKAYELLLSNASKSIEDMEMYIKFIINISLDYTNFSMFQKSIANIICDYIDLHYAENMNRNSIAEIVYLDSDYAARLFKKEFGISLGTYIIQKRISIAKYLLTSTNILVSTISDKVGYGNYSYFTKLFKKETSYTPIDYRQKYSTHSPSAQ